jgi:hypothetical protein
MKKKKVANQACASWCEKGNDSNSLDNFNEDHCDASTLTPPLPTLTDDADASEKAKRKELKKIRKDIGSYTCACGSTREE